MPKKFMVPSVIFPPHSLSSHLSRSLRTIDLLFVYKLAFTTNYFVNELYRIHSMLGFFHALQLF